MKTKQLRFFSQNDNTVAVPEKEKKAKAVPLTGSISGFGRLVLPEKTVGALGIDAAATRFKIATIEGKRKLKTLYLVPTQEDGDDAFALEKKAQNYNIPIAGILKNSGLDYSQEKYEFSLKPFDHEGTTAYELKLSQQGEKPPYTGKPRGRKKKVDA